jgi:hypothetical protein
MSGNCSPIENRNFLSPNQFKFTLKRAPKAAFFSNSGNIPALRLGTANQPTYLKMIDQPGDMITFEDFTFKFMVDEDLTNYTEIQNWIRGLGFPYSLQQIIDLQKTRPDLKSNITNQLNIVSDGTLFILSSNNKTNVQVRFYDMWPYDLTSLLFDTTRSDSQYLTAEVKMKYTYYDIRNAKGELL